MHTNPPRCRPQLSMRSLLLTFALTSGVTAQDPGEEATGPPTTAAERLLAQQQREAMMPKVHIRGTEARLPSDMRAAPVQLVGIEEGGNGFRQRTPSLANGERGGALVDGERLRQRRLAVYTEPVGDEPEPPADDDTIGAPEPAPDVVAPAPAAAPQDVRQSVAGFRTVTIGTALVLLLGVGVVVLKNRRAGS